MDRLWAALHDVHDPGVLERRRRASFAQQARARLGVADVGGDQELHGDGSTEPLVARADDDPHGPAREDLLEDVPLRDPRSVLEVTHRIGWYSMVSRAERPSMPSPRAMPPARR